MTVTLYDRHHVHLVLLAGLRNRPASGSDLADEIARRSGGWIVPGTRRVFSELHHLARNALVASDGPGRYRLTDAGERSLRHRERRWAAYVAAADGVRNGARTEPAPAR